MAKKPGKQPERTIQTWETMLKLDVAEPSLSSTVLKCAPLLDGVKLQDTAKRPLVLVATDRNGEGLVVVGCHEVAPAACPERANSE